MIFGGGTGPYLAYLIAIGEANGEITGKQCLGVIAALVVIVAMAALAMWAIVN